MEDNISIYNQGNWNPKEVTWLTQSQATSKDSTNIQTKIFCI